MDDLDENYDFIDEELNILMILPLPCAGANQEYLSTLKVGLNANLEKFVVKAENSARSIRQRPSFRGAHDKLEGMLAILAKSYCASGFIFIRRRENATFLHQHKIFY